MLPLSPNGSIHTLWTVLLLLAASLLCCAQFASFRQLSTCGSCDPLPRPRKLSLVTTLMSYEPEAPLCSKTQLQQLAIRSWLDFADEVVLLVDDPSGCKHATRLSSKIKCAPHDCVNPQHRKPSMPCLFKTGEAVASGDVIMYTNPDFAYAGVKETLAAVPADWSQFVIVGRRVSIDAEALCRQHSTASHTDLLRLGEELGQVDPDHAGWAMDYFLYTKGSLPLNSMPPFIVGVWRWDNWLLGEAVRYGTARVIDASETLGATHLGSTEGTHAERKGASYNNYLWLAALPGNRPIPKPAGLGDMQFAPYVTVAYNGQAAVFQNDTAVLLVAGHVEDIQRASISPPPPPPPPSPSPSSPSPSPAHSVAAAPSPHAATPANQTSQLGASTQAASSSVSHLPPAAAPTKPAPSKL